MADEIKMRKISPKVPEYISEMKNPKPDYPRIYLNLDTIPEAKDWPMNGTYKIVLIGELVGLNNNEGKGGIELEIHEAGASAIKASGRVSRKSERGASKDEKNTEKNY